MACTVSSSQPIEHLWSYLKLRLAEYEIASTGMDELWRSVRAEWMKIPGPVCQKLIATMPKSVKPVIIGKRCYTKYEHMERLHCQFKSTKTVAME